MISKNTIRLLDFRVVIPARYASSRLPGKPLLDIGGKPMIVHACERAIESGAMEVIVATDDKRIKDAVTNVGIRVVMTQPDHTSGTERIAEVAQICGWDEDEIVVNLQGDEPLMDSLFVTRAAEALANQNLAGVATLAATISNPTEIFNPNAVKVVLDSNSYALYFSRAPIPWDREDFKESSQFSRQNSQDIGPNTPLDNLKASSHLRHIGLYAYSVGFLKRYVQWATSPLEKIECLEQLRILWQGERILVVPVDKAPEAGIDTPADLERVRSILLSA